MQPLSHFNNFNQSAFLFLNRLLENVFLPDQFSNFLSEKNKQTKQYVDLKWNGLHCLLAIHPAYYNNEMALIYANNEHSQYTELYYFKHSLEVSRLTQTTKLIIGISFDLLLPVSDMTSSDPFTLKSFFSYYA